MEEGRARPAVPGRDALPGRPPGEGERSSGVPGTGAGATAIARPVRVVETGNTVSFTGPFRSAVTRWDE